MSSSLIGMMYGIALGFAAAFGGFTAFLLVGALGAAGYGVGWFAERSGVAESVQGRSWGRDR